MLSEKSPRPKGKCRPVPLARVPRTGRSAATGSSTGCQGRGQGEGRGAGSFSLRRRSSADAGAGRATARTHLPLTGSLKNGKKGEFYVIYVSQ